MKRIMNKISILAILALALACKDESLDPFRFTELKKGSLLALRGDDGTAGSLDPDQNFFFRDNITGNETFSYIADFISEDQTLLSGVQVYGKLAISNEPQGARKLIKTVPGSAFVSPSANAPRQGTVTITLDEILTTMGLDAEPDTISRTNLIIESDIELTDGTIVPSSAIVNSGLFAANAFFPAHKLNYYAEDAADFVPVATTKMAGEVVKDADGKVTSRPVFPLKSGAKDTVYATFDQNLLNTPSFAYSNAAITGAGVVKVNAKTFYEIVTAGAGFTGAVTLTVSGGQANTFGPTLTQDDKKQTINVDNTTPQIASTNTGTRVGRGQLTTITVKFNEKMSAKSANRIKITIDDPNDKIKDKDIADSAFPANMTLASDGLSVSYVFLVEELTPNTAVHDNLDITFTGGADEAGNSITIPSTTVTLDVGVPPAPDLTLATGHDLGTQIKWSGMQDDAVANTGGAIQGTIYFVAVDANEAAPTDVEFDQDANAIWTMATGVTQRASGKLATGTDGTTGIVFTSFAANGTFDIYAVFVGTTGNVSAIPVTPQLQDVIMQ